ncbi:phage terminase large subunit family protein [Pseudomonas veronii]|uniref:phage terminase large subunit family protein n=1 Tax=Pseudomonas veronii TaxID=76761 RepID=UPI001E4EF795|nr:phage terminase large subunit family protein [Pseudomonas veronii]UHH33243.1 phage terminase large subunit family protein [Pseudomonas veronii]
MGSTSDERRYAEGFDALQAGLLSARRRNIQPPPKLTLSQWAEKYAVLSRETSAQTGRFHAFPYQIGIMDAITDPTVEMVTVQKSARVGYTKILDHVAGYYIHQDPSPILVVQPRVEDAEDYSVTEIEPMLRDTPVLAEIVGDPKKKDARQKINKRIFRNGASISFVGANSPGGFRRITARIVKFDEVDGYPVMGAGKEGDQIKLGIKRTESFWNRKIILGSTPTVKGESRIEKSYANSDQRKYYVPCPHCGEYQVLEWGGPDTPYGMKWDKDENGVGLPDSVFYACKVTGCVIREADKEEMVERGEWRATKPFKGHAGFHIWAAYSLFVNASWRNLVAEWLEVKDDPLMRQTFVNLVLGETYEDRGDRALQEDRLAARCEVWGAEVPDGVAVVTVGVDTQGDRFECEVVGWGLNEESWSIDFEVIQGDLETPDPWNRLDAYLRRIWFRADGRGFEVMAVCHDSGGHHTQKVYEFAKARLGRRVWAVKGESAVGGKRSPVWPTKTPSRRNKSSFRPVILGVNAAKDSVRSRLHLVEPGAGYMHFPVSRDINYFAQLTAERSVRKTSGGQHYRVWELPNGRANEALDCRVYAYAALCGLMHMGLKLNKRAEEVNASIGTPVHRPELQDQEPVVDGGKQEQSSGPRVIQAKPAKKKTLASRLA